MGPRAEALQLDVDRLDDFEARFQAARHRLLAICTPMVGSDEAHDVVQDTYIAARARLGRLRDPNALEAWLVRIAVNRCMDRLVTASIGMAYLTETRDGAPHQQILVLRRGPDGWVAIGGQGGEYPAAGAAVGVSPLGVDKGMPDDRWAAVGVATEGTAAVELEFGRFVHQYPVNGDAFIIQIPSSAGFGLHYRLLDASGDAIGEGTSIP